MYIVVSHCRVFLCVWVCFLFFFFFSSLITRDLSIFSCADWSFILSVIVQIFARLWKLDCFSYYWLVTFCSMFRIPGYQFLVRYLDSKYSPSLWLYYFLNVGFRRVEVFSCDEIQFIAFSSYGADFCVLCKEFFHTSRFWRFFTSIFFLLFLNLGIGSISN